MTDGTYRIGGHLGATITNDGDHAHSEITDAEVVVTEYIDSPSPTTGERGIHLSANSGAGQSDFSQIDVFLPAEAIEQIAESAAKIEGAEAQTGRSDDG